MMAHVIYGVPCDVIVAQDGSGDFRTIQAAIDAVNKSPHPEKPVTIGIKPGTYFENCTFADSNDAIQVSGEE